MKLGQWQLGRKRVENEGIRADIVAIEAGGMMMLPQLYALHVHAAKRGDGLRNEFFRRYGGQTLTPLPTIAQISGPAPVAAPANMSREMPAQDDEYRSAG
ncbi:MAG: hypothetical protein ACTHJY_07990 [Rhizobiaceae bacterium]